MTKRMQGVVSTMRKGFEGIRELADLENHNSSPNAVGSLLGDVSKLSQGVCVKKTNEGEVYVFNETIDSDGEKYVKVAIKKVDNNEISTYEELSYIYVIPHQAWYYNSYDGIAKGVRAARIWEGENDPILGYCLRYARSYDKFEEADLPTAEKLRNDPRYIHLYDRQGIGIYLDMSSVKVNVCNPPIYDISGIYYHIRFGEQVACSKRMNRIKYDEDNKTTWSMDNGKWISMNVSGGSMASRGNFSVANHLFHIVYGRDFYESNEKRNSVQSALPSEGTTLIQNTKSDRTSSDGVSLQKHHLVIGIACLLILGFFLGNNDSSTSKNTSKPQAAVSATTNKSTPKGNVPIEAIAKRNVVTGYDSSKPILNDTGLCELTIDNSRNDMPVYVRIWDMDSYLPVRAFYIAQGDKFTAYELTRGTYEVRYIELYDNDFPANGAKSELFELEQIESAYGVQYSQMSLTLYKVRNGNTTTTSIPANQI